MLKICGVVNGTFFILNDNQQIRRNVTLKFNPVQQYENAAHNVFNVSIDNFNQVPWNLIKKQYSVVDTSKPLDIKCNGMAIEDNGQLNIYSILNDKGTYISACGDIRNIDFLVLSSITRIAHQIHTLYSDFETEIDTLDKIVTFVRENYWSGNTLFLHTISVEDLIKSITDNTGNRKDVWSTEVFNDQVEINTVTLNDLATFKYELFSIVTPRP